MLAFSSLVSVELANTRREQNGFCFSLNRTVKPATLRTDLIIPNKHTSGFRC